MSVAPQRPHATVEVAPEHSHAAEQPVLLRLVEPGPPPEPPALAEPPDGYARPARGRGSAALSGLPDLRPHAGGPVAAAQRPPARPARVAITEAEARGLAGTMARAVLDVLEGRRPVHQLGTLLGERAVATVHMLVRGGLRWPVRRATVTGVRVFQPGRAAIEACVTFTCEGGRTRVLALRIDREHRRWVGTAVRVG